MTAPVHFTTPLPRQPRRWSFVAAFFLLAPVVLWASSAREGLLTTPVLLPVRELLGGVTWALWEPGRFLPRVQLLLLEWTGAGTRAAPLVGLLLGSFVLMLLTVPAAAVRTSPKRRLAAGSLLALMPGFLLAVTMAAPVLWGLAGWAIAIRAMAASEGRDNIQQNMSVAFGLCVLMLAEPLAWILVVPALVGMPILLRRDQKRATAAAMALCVLPPILLLAAVVLAVTILTESAPLPHLLRWLRVVGSTDPMVPLVVMGPDLARTIVLVAVPAFVLTCIALRDTRRRHHPVTLLIATAAPTIALCLLAGIGHGDAARIVALYAVAGQAMWLAQTPLPRRRFRLGIAVALLGLAGQFVL